MDIHHPADSATGLTLRSAWTASIRCLLLIISAVMAAGCASPVQRMDDLATRLGYTRTTVAGIGFPEVVYEHNLSNEGHILHVYLGGDGSPWLHRYWVSSDPTPRNPVMLKLMALDRAPSLYLSRPCYDGYAKQPPCNPLLWTQARYSRGVVDNMAAILRKRLDTGRFHGVMLFGFSGGGALAMLLAERIPETRVVITLAGNLDTDAWSDYHDYSPLTDSLNPARQPTLARSIVQLHIAGDKDTNIPLAITRQALKHQPQARLVVMKGYDHVCCWQRIWPDVLKGVEEGRPWAYIGAAAPP